MKFEKIDPYIPLCFEGLQCGEIAYPQLVGEGFMPRVLLVHPWLVGTAYEIYAKYPTVQRLPVIPIPGVKDGFWAVVGPEAIVVGNPGF